MAEAPVAPQPVNEAAFRSPESRANSQGATHGTKTTTNHQRFVTPVKIEFNVPISQNAFNLAKSHQEILKLMKDKDPTLDIIPSKTGKEKFSDLLKFPANEIGYNQMFVHAVDKQPTEARKIIVKHSLITAMKFSDLKFQNAQLMNHMLKNKIWVRYNQSETLQVAALGFIQGVHPRVTHRDGFTQKLQAAIQMEMTEAERSRITTLLPPCKQPEGEEGELKAPDIKVEAMSRMIGYGNRDAHIKTEAFEIRVPLEICIEIKEIMTRLGTKNTIPKGRFIPYGLVQTVGAEVYKKMLRMQNDFLTDFRLVPVFGIAPQALKHTIKVEFDDSTERHMTVKEFILAKDCIKGLETTNRADDLGKHFLILDVAGIFETRDFVDTVLKQLYESGRIPQEMIHPNFLPPRRGDAPRTTATFYSYATALANLGNPQDDATQVEGTAPKPRPAKRNVQMVYDLQASEFPNLPQRSQPKKASQSTTPEEIEPRVNTTGTAAAAVTQDALVQMQEEMKREFQNMIKQEVKLQIQQEMTAMQAEMAKMSAKMDTMRDGIKDSVGQAIREAMRASFSEYQSPQQYTQYRQASPAQQNPAKPNMSFPNRQDGTPTSSQGVRPMVTGAQN
jgi:hypothetical protein